MIHPGYMTSCHKDVMKNPPEPIRLHLKPSRRLSLFIDATHFTAFGLLLWLETLEASVLILVAPVLASWHLRRKTFVALKGREAIRLLEWRPEGDWVLYDGQAVAQSAKLLGSSTVWSWIVILGFSAGTFKRRYVILPGDNADADQVRRLKVRLRLERAPGYDKQGAGSASSQS